METTIMGLGFRDGKEMETTERGHIGIAKRIHSIIPS